mmetsp:Transcript_31242/g.92999  ORF Transcript_31242/g.92999 Transcript_31242/m.92999 type:complete len:236 (-) Transcript_31242:875-1582(-)
MARQGGCICLVVLRGCQTSSVALLRLERVVCGSSRVLARIPSGWRIAMVLQEQPVLILAMSQEDPLQTQIDEHVLAPLALAGAELDEVLHAVVRATAEGLHGVAGEHLDRPVHAELAIIQIGSSVALVVSLQQSAQPRRDEDGIRVGFHRPVVEKEPAVLDYLGPDCQEHVCVQHGAKLSTPLDEEVAEDGTGHDGGGHLEGRVAVGGVLVAAEDTGVVPVLQSEQGPLVAEGQD